ncbi:hypothetical protein BST36_25450 [Mycolicibacterium moriokaense]|uniref:Uncharacterized protein n=1 Tax=Mycolicibacterium moriokaense TaxID=39691 RepID=A0AAD1HEN1_9MYCO|nr:hypothetical protein [Mycolicibacterium moriokaense]MCV7042514.1 hypothetical protein [Mycolicibacterium moriokaense]ORB16999.1 hypothetical protein BST36_25450 [Mycolicibacterium moriokaense]BBX04048.1 hypothetical protein MMOR_49840 [Mycolicibacterium moriokaense]
MNLVESIERGLAWLSTPRWIPGRLEMETKRGQRLELEIVSFRMRVPIPGGAVVRVPLFIALMPAGSSPIQGDDGPSGEDSN